MLRRLLLPSAGFLAIYIAQTINTGLDNLVIAAFRPPAEVTQYAVALRLVFVNTGIFAVMTETLAPYVTADFTLQRNERLRTGYILFLKLGFLYGVSATIGLWFLGPAVIRAWAGPGIFPGKLTFGLQVIYLLTNVLANPAYTVLTATMRHYGLTVVAVIECVINLTLSIWLVQRWGIAGVIAGSVFAHLLTNAWYMQYAALQILDIPISQVLNELAPAALLSVIALGAALIVEPFKALPMFAGTAVISTIVALPVFVTAFALVVFNADERNQAWFALARFIQSRGREGLAG